MVVYQKINTPLGVVLLGQRNGKVVFCHFALPSLEAVLKRVQADFSGEEIMDGDKYGYAEAKAYYLQDLLQGRGKIFHWEDLQLRGTHLQIAVWMEMFKLLPDELITYSALAQRCGYPQAVRAVATAVGKNPVSLIIPCHRVVRKGGELGNYYWGKDLKRKILEWEGII